MKRNIHVLLADAIYAGPDKCYFAMREIISDLLSSRMR